MCQAEAPRGKEYRRPARSNLAVSSSHLLSTRVEARACAMDLAAEQKRRQEVAALAVPALVEERRQQTVFAASRRCPAFVPKNPCSKDWTARALTHERRRGYFWIMRVRDSQPGRCVRAVPSSESSYTLSHPGRAVSSGYKSCSSRAVYRYGSVKGKRERRLQVVGWACGLIGRGVWCMNAMRSHWCPLVFQKEQPD
jgi:hypothetical protein